MFFKLCVFLQSQIKGKIEKICKANIRIRKSLKLYFQIHCSFTTETVRNRVFFNWNSKHETLAWVSSFSSTTSFSYEPPPWSKSVGDFWIDSLILDYNCFQCFDGDDVGDAFFLFQQEQLLQQRKLRVNRLLQYPASEKKAASEAALFHPFLFPEGSPQAILQSLQQKILQ